MTAINFPDNPQPGDTFLNFAWDGEKWRNAGSRASAIVFKDLFSRRKFRVKSRVSSFLRMCNKIISTPSPPLSSYFCCLSFLSSKLSRVETLQPGINQGGGRGEL